MKSSITFPSILVLTLLLSACGGNHAELQNETNMPVNASSEIPTLPRSMSPGELLPIGTPIPEFQALDETGAKHNRASLSGKNVVLIFYPGDDTPGCTAQLCAVRDDWKAYQRADVLVFGVNTATAESHAAFSNKYNFPFPLLVDESGDLMRAFGSESPMGMTKRTVYGIDKSGVVVFAERGMPATSEILAAFRS